MTALDSRREHLIEGALWAIVLVFMALLAVVVVTVATPDPRFTFDSSLTPSPVVEGQP